jgi:hypothetical protein
LSWRPRRWVEVAFALLLGLLFVGVFLTAVYLRPEWWTP